MIEVEALGKDFEVPVKESGLRAAIKHFFAREVRTVHAVRELSFRIEPGEMVGFLGPNGAGKTTTLKMLTGLIHPSRGRVRVLGFEPFLREADYLRRITLVMGQKQQLIWDLPAVDSLRINASIYDIPEAAAQRRIEELSELLELGEALRQPVRKLSLGQRMKAELLAALLHEPEVLFLDEPTLGLDVNAQTSVRRFLKDYNARTGATILLTSHYMADIQALCERVLLIHDGDLIHDGKLDKLLERVAPFRELDLELAAPVERAELETWGEVAELDGCRARLLIERATLAKKVGELLGTLSVVDLTVKDPPIEDVIGRVFKEGLSGATARDGSGAEA